MLPAEFLSRFASTCPPDLLNDALASFAAKEAVAFRINRLGAPAAEGVLAELATHGIEPQPVDWAQAAGIWAYTCPQEQREALTYTPAAGNGTIYIQSLSSMLAPLLLAPQREEWVLDLAAAPGGKTILLAEMMNNGGKISAVEPVSARYHRLKANLARMGVGNTQTYLKDGRVVGSLKPDCFDRVMLDAPCSSESRFKTWDAASHEHWSPAKVSECAKKQKRLILSAFDALKPGGVLMYCTCSFAPEENELIVDHLLKKREGVRLLPIALALPNLRPGLTAWKGKPLAAACAETRRVWPTGEMDGFYLALIGKG